MEIQEFHRNFVVLGLTRSDLGTMGNSLNEVCNGFHVADFERKIGVPESEAEHFLHEIGKTYRQWKAESMSYGFRSFSRRELRAIIGAFHEVFIEMDYEFELHTRLGAWRWEMDKILSEITLIYQRMIEARNAGR